tara:strand:+ start:284 stop:508 length:225 start_codon:yes stop_codon:yes gene_type:complete
MWKIIVIILALQGKGERDFVMVDNYLDKPLEFKTLRECDYHVRKNLPDLIEFSRLFYKNGERVVVCVKKKGIKT